MSINFEEGQLHNTELVGAWFRERHNAESWLAATGETNRLVVFEPIPVSTYPNGEPFFKFEDVERFGTVPNALLLRPKSMQTFIAALMLAQAFKLRRKDVPALVLPLPPGSRQDRLNDKGDYLFTARWVAEAINQCTFPKIAVLDPHSDVLPGLLDRVVVFPCAFNSLGWNVHPSKYLGVIAPDGGAIKRAHVLARQNGLQVFHAWKSRDVSTGALSGFGVETLKPGHYLVVDDLCDAGGTFIGLAQKLRESGCTADLFVTHGLFTKGTQALLDCYQRVICTDSTVGPKQGCSVLPVCENLLANAY